MSPSAFELILNQQREWAARRGLAVDAKGYVADLDANLYQPLCMATVFEFDRGLGREMSRHMRALHSSSALVCNVFEYWRQRSRGVSVIAEALGAPGVQWLQFERPHPTPIGGYAPHVDIEIAYEGGHLAVESKFLEPYMGAKPVKKTYGRPGLWRQVGLEELVPFAQALAEGELSFRFLDANQLLAHILGLSRSYGRDFRLLYLWYDTSAKESGALREEIAQFREGLAGHVRFEDSTYQDLYSRLSSHSSAQPDYFGYLRDRYQLADARNSPS